MNPSQSYIPTKEKVKLFSDMVLCCHNLYYTVFTSDRQTVFHNSPDPLPVNMLFFDSIDQKAADLLLPDQPRPILLSSKTGIFWLVIPVVSEDCMHVLGPFFLTDIPEKEIKNDLSQRHFSIPRKRQIIAFLRELPVISINRIFEYAVMLYYCLFGEKLTIDSILFMGGQPTQPSPEKEDSEPISHGTYEAEQEMLRMVREGDLNYRTLMNKIAVTGTVGKLCNGDPLRQMKNSILVAVTLFSRAAIEGGLNPEVSYALTDYYFQSVEACNDIADLADIMHTMQEDFIQRVHSCRLSMEYSAPVRACIEYLDYHPEENINWKSLVTSLGYDEYYFSKKFKKETGRSPKEYLLERRFARAEFLLKKTTKSVGEISSQLHFCSQSYFTEQFKKRYHMTPIQYRETKVFITHYSPGCSSILCHTF